MYPGCENMVGESEGVRVKVEVISRGTESWDGVRTGKEGNESQICSCSNTIQCRINPA
jgi:hypothetical protein